MPCHRIPSVPALLRVRSGGGSLSSRAALPFRPPASTSFGAAQHVAVVLFREAKAAAAKKKEEKKKAAPKAQANKAAPAPKGQAAGGLKKGKR